jgi:putative ABC transport system substrate-binding protein
MRRRDILRLLSVAALGRTSGMAAQPADRVRRIGWIEASSAGMNMDNWGDVATELRSLGWIRGGNVQVDRRVPFSTGDLKDIARELVEAQPDLIVTNGTLATVAVLAHTRSIAVLFFGIADPVGNDLVGNLSRPDGNVTGFASYEPSLAGKWVELLKEVKPDVRRAAILFNPETTPNRSSPFIQEFEATAQALSLEPISAFAQDAVGIEAAIADLAAKADGALLVLPDLFTLIHRQMIIGLAGRYRVPAIYGLRYAAVTGGLIAYGPSLTGLYRGIASYIDKILRGTRPSALPIQAPTTYELVVNLRTARALGLPIPTTILAAADEVID